jgi:nitrogenase molybdenum-iron protein alpha/beta subunit
MDFLAKEEDVLRTGSNEIAFPVTDSEGNEEFIQIVVKVPTGSRDGEPYNGYQMAEDYSLKLKLQQEKAEKARIAKEKKIAKDAQMRKEKEKVRKMNKEKMEAELEKGK